MTCHRNLFALLIASIVGCGSGTEDRVPAPSLDPEAMAAKATTTYDTDSSGELSIEELAAVPGIASAVDHYDADKNGAVSTAEIASQIQSWVDTRVAITMFSCRVTLDGQPLHNATIELIPEPFLADVIHAAKGVTNEAGEANLGMPQADLPESMKGSTMVNPGIYKIRITHATTTIPAIYNTETTLGIEVSPTSPLIDTPLFELKSR